MYFLFDQSHGLCGYQWHFFQQNVIWEMGCLRVQFWARYFIFCTLLLPPIFIGNFSSYVDVDCLIRYGPIIFVLYLSFRLSKGCVFFFHELSAMGILSSHPHRYWLMVIDPLQCVFLDLLPRCQSYVWRNYLNTWLPKFKPTRRKSSAA